MRDKNGEGTAREGVDSQPGEKPERVGTIQSKIYSTRMRTETGRDGNVDDVGIDVGS